MNLMKEFTKGFVKENPVFVLLLGMCPALGVTGSAINGLGMGLASTAVLLGSNVVISILKNFIPDKVRIPCFIVVIACFVTIIDLTMAAYLPELHEQLGLFIPLIVVNCLILGRAEAFASKNPVIPSAADGLGMGLGFTLSLTVLGAIREILGNGTITYGPDTAANVINVMSASFEPFTFMVQAPGAFVCLGLLLGIMNIFGD